ncbi:hypothetical protein EX30DRAFT_178244 [Ascodesmis nigricans]|uniref:Uncharacterized protein n=1 Tax=Ascodesmis nigricans TaxID=341454 RepID=A0A4S2MLF1_9PEZI|nr:hypothetical protein EX30DRAFT_178244 [Ascodesmis nigricans]
MLSLQSTNRPTNSPPHASLSLSFTSFEPTRLGPPGLGFMHPSIHPLHPHPQRTPFPKPAKGTHTKDKRDDDGHINDSKKVLKPTKERGSVRTGFGSVVWNLTRSSPRIYIHILHTVCIV